MDFQTISDQTLGWLATNGLRIFLIAVLTFVALRVARIVSRRVFESVKDEEKLGEEEAHKRAETLSALVSYVLKTAVLLLGGVMMLGQIGIKIGPILAAAGVLGIAVGFGAQRLVQDIISGFFILIDDQIRAGDVVEIAGKSGLVERVTIRMTTLRDFAGSVHYVRNSQIDVVTNKTKGFSCAVFEIGIAYRENVDDVVRLMKEIGEDLRSDTVFSQLMLEPLEVLGLDRFADSALIIKARIKTRPRKQWDVSREFNRRLKKRFDEEGIEIPFPHMTLYLGQDKAGDAPPLHVAMPQSGGTN